MKNQIKSANQAQQPIDDLRALAQENIQAAYQAVDSTPAGLSDQQVNDRLKKFGANVIEQKKPESTVKRFFKSFSSLMAWLLWIGGIVAFFAGTPTLGIAIWLVNIINGLFSFWQEYRAAKATDALSKLLPSYVRVKRNGKDTQVLTQDIVPGDVVYFEEGDNVPADIRISSATDLRAVQASLTGEPNPISKSSDVEKPEEIAKGRFALSNILFTGTAISTGSGTGVVVATGMNTEFGHIAHLTQSVKDDLSPLEKELNVLTKQISLIAVSIGIVFMLAAVFLVHYPIAKAFIFALGMVVAFIPEGLLPTVTLSLALATQSMAKKHALVKQLSSVETLGSTNVICSDKTGTLTQNQMTVQSIWMPKELLSVTGTGYSNNGQILHDGQPVTVKQDDDLMMILRASSLCSNAKIVAPDKGHPTYTILGDPTEACLSVVAQKGDLDPASAQAKTPRIKELPFDSVRKRMTVIESISDDPMSRIAYIKGAPNEVANLCTTYLDNGQTVPMTSAMLDQIKTQNDTYAKDGLRVLAIAFRTINDQTDLPKSVDDYTIDNVEKNLTFIGLMAMSDPPRPGVKDAIAECHRASIKVIMVTGDYGLTAESIARKIGIVEPGESVQVVSGTELENMDDDHLKAVLKGQVIFARMAPEQKYRIVDNLQQLGNVVAVTGDGVNDAPALKKADIGIAMGQTGTDVAKEAAKMILTDDNFASIVAAIREGRTVYSNIQKFLLYILNSNEPEAAPSVAFLFSRGMIPLPLTVMQILSVDLGTDMFPALGLGTEQPEPGIMDQPPRAKSQHLINKGILLKAFAWYGLVASLISLGGYFFVNYEHGWPTHVLFASGPIYREATTMALACIVFCQIAAAMNCRTKTESLFKVGLFTNKHVIYGIIFEVLLLACLIYLPPLQLVFNTAPLQLQEWIFLIIIPIPLILIEEFRKYLVRKHDSHQTAKH